MLTDTDLERSIGARDLRPGFARTPQLDLWWACGYPHLVIIGDVRLRKGPIAWLESREGIGLSPGPWAAEAVHTAIHVSGSSPVAYKGRSSAEIRAQFTERLEAAAAAGPADEAACHRALEVCLNRAKSGYEVDRLIYVVEAVLGTQPTLEYVLDAWESTDLAELGRSASGMGTLPLYLPPMLRRLTPEAHEDVVARLTTLRDRVLDARTGTYQRKPNSALHHHLFMTLDLILGGAEAVVDLQIRNPRHAVVCEDGPFLSGYMTGLTGEKWKDVAPRAAFAAPDATILHYTTCWDEYTRKEQQQLLVEVLSTLADPRILPWMFSMTMGSKARVAAKKWFVAHRDETAAFVLAQRDDPNGRYKQGAAKLAKAMKL